MFESCEPIFAFTHKPVLLCFVAHCLYDSNGKLQRPKYALLAGIFLDPDDFEEVLQVDLYFRPTKYVHSKFYEGNDIALIRLKSPSSMTPAILDVFKPSIGTEVVAVGWGANEKRKLPLELQYATLKVNTNRAPCQYTFPNLVCTGQSPVYAGDALSEPRHACTLFCLAHRLGVCIAKPMLLLLI
jgi:hypothetical protein